MPKERMSVIKKVLARAITVPKEELEVTEIVSGQPLSDTVEVILGMREGEVKIIELSSETVGGDRYIPERKVYLFTPLNQIASVLGLDIRVKFFDVSGVPIYFVIEPEVTDLVKKIYVFLKSRIGEVGLSSGADIIKFAKESFEDIGLDARLAFAEKDVKSAVYYLWRDLIGYGPLEIPMEDVNVEEISWYAYDGPVLVVDGKVKERYPNSEFVFTNIFIPKSLDRMKKKFFMTQIVRTITSRARAGLTTAKPIAETRIPDPSGKGFHRLAAHLDITSRSPGLTIRKFPQIKYSLTQLIHYNTLSALEAAYLLYQLIKRGFILIVGGMASGKSLYSNDFVLAKTREGITLTTFEKLWNMLAGDYTVKRVGEMEVIENPDIEILTLTRTSTKWVKPKYIIRHRHKGKMYRIKTKTGREITVTADHSLLVWKVGDEKDRFSIYVVPIKPEEIVEKQSYLPYLRKLVLPNAGTLVRGRVKNPKFGYMLGFFVAEGYINGYTPTMHQAIGNVLNHVLHVMNELGFAYRVTPEKRKPHMRYISIYDADFKYYVKTVGKKAREKRVPDIFWSMGEEWRGAFLAGVIDGDGSVHPGKYIIEIATASRELAYGLLYAFASVGVHAYIREKRVKKYPGRVYYRVFVPIGINKAGLSKIMKYLSEEKRRLIEEAMEKSSNHHSETDIIPAEIAYAIGSMLKRLEHGRDERLSFELRSYRYKEENPSFHRIEEMLGEKLYEFIPRSIGFDQVEEIEEVEYDGYVYDIEVPETENFEANGIFVHNTTLLQALISALPVSYKVVCVAPGTRVAAEKPVVIDSLFVGTPRRKDNVETVERTVRVLGFRDGGVVWSTSNEVHKIHIPRDVKLVRIVTEYGAEVTVTPNTKIPVFTENGIVYKPAEEVREGDVVPQLSRYDVEERDPPVREILEATRFRVHLKTEGRDRKGRQVKSYTISRWIEEGRPEYVGIRFKRSKHVIRVPPDRLPSPEVSYLAGYVVGDGSIHKAVKTVHVAVSPNNTKLRERIEKIIRMLGLPVKYFESSMQYVLPTTLGYYLEALYEIPSGKKSDKVRVPSWMFTAPIEHVRAYLAGVIDSDGTVTKDYVAISSTSKEFIEDLAVLFLRLGVIGKLYSQVNKNRSQTWTVWNIRVEGEFYNKLVRELSGLSVKVSENGRAKDVTMKSSNRMIPSVLLSYLVKKVGGGTVRERWIAGSVNREEWKKRRHVNIEELLSIAEKYGVRELAEKMLNDKIIWVYVKKVNKVDHSGIVYDLTPRETRYFFAGNGGFIVVEDTIEDTPELSTPAQNWHPLYVRRAPKESELENVDFSRLVIHSLRHRGTVVTLGEVRGKEMADLIQAAASVAKDTPVLVRIDGETRYTTIGAVVDEEYGDSPDWTRVVPKRKIEVLTLTKDGKVEFKPVQWVLRHRHRGVLYRIWYRVKTNPSLVGFVDVTANHSIFAARGNGLVAVRGDEIREGDTVIVSDVKGRKSEGEVIRVETIDYDGYVYDFSVPDTEAFFGGNFFFTLLHNSGHGAICLRPDARVIVRLYGKEHLMRMKDVYREVARGTPLEILSYDLRAGKPVWKEITRAYHVKTRRWIRLYTASGRVLEITPDHQLPVLDKDGKPVIKHGNEIEAGDKLLIAPPLPKTRGIKKFLIVSNRYIEIDQTLGKLYAAVLARGRTYSKKLTIPKDIGEDAVNLLKKVSRVRTGRTRISASQNAIRMIERLEEIIRAHPLSLPTQFLNGFYETLKQYGETLVRVHGEDLAHALHYALRTIGVDTVVHGDTLGIIGGVKGLVADTVTRIEVLEPEGFEDAYDIEVEDTHTFITESSIVSMNCTFHAHDPETVLARITSPPINAAPESLLLITSIVHIAHTKTFVGGRPKSVRRVMRIFEIKDVKGRRVESDTIFAWKPLTDTHVPVFIPNNLEKATQALKHLWEHSRTIRTLGANIYGQDEQYRVLVDIFSLAYYLDKLAKKEVFDIKSLLLNLTAFYLRMDAISDKYWKKYFIKLFTKYGIIPRR